MLSCGQYFDLIILDIELTEINGIAIGKYLREELNNQTTQIVYISSLRDYAMDLFAVRPLHFLIKPLKKDEFYGKLDDIEAKLNNKYFLRFHKSFLVHYRWIRSFSPKAVILNDGKIITITRSQQKKVLEALIDIDRDGLIHRL